MERDHEQAILRIQNTLQAEALNEADFLHITGSGDPFGSPYFRRWLQSMKKPDMPRLEWIHLHSNGLLWTPKMWQSISEEVRQLIKSAEISIDAATAATYAVNRRGGSFETLLKNLGFISALRQDGPLNFLKISMVVQANNFTEMPDFVRLGRQLRCDQVYFSQVVNWGTFTRDEFARRAIHLPTHPQHSAFLGVLQDQIFDEPIVDLGNLTTTREAARKPWSKHFGRLPRKIWSRVQTHLLNARG
ncbi:MAG: radical SAM protein [Vicinamibacteraceae bacterium]